MTLYDVKAKMHGESYDAISELSQEAGRLLKDFACDHDWQLSGLVSGQERPDDGFGRVVLHAELNAPQGGHITVDFVRYDNSRLGIDNKVVLRAFSRRGELASSVLRGLKLRPLRAEDRSGLLRGELERLAGYMDLF